jgi:uncharacterized phage protein (TIGR01671 family)
MLDMRDIKFRMWDTKEMIMSNSPGYLINLHGDIYTVDNVNGVTYYKRDDYILMQYTGLTDKNGKEIYEGDILRYGYLALNDTEKFGKDPHLNLPKGIKEDDITTEMGVFEVKPEIGFLANVEEMITRNPDVEGVEIIGNIYENPELLK